MSDITQCPVFAVFVWTIQDAIGGLFLSALILLCVIAAIGEAIIWCKKRWEKRRKK